MRKHEIVNLLRKVCDDRDHWQDQMRDVANATEAAMDERCDALERHCTCVPLLRAEVLRLRRYKEDVEAEAARAEMIPQNATRPPVGATE